MSESFESAQPANGRNGNHVAGRAMPHSDEAEEYLLSCCLLDGSDTIARCLDRPLPPGAFYTPANSLVYQKLCELYKANPPIDLAMLAQELKMCGQLEAVGGYAYLTKISARVPTTAQAQYFIDKVAELHTLREVIKVSTRAVEEAFNYTGELPTFLEETKARFDTAVQSGVSVDVLESLAYDATKVIPKPEAIFTLAKTCISTPGNLTTLYSQAKAGKSTLIGAMMAAAMTTPTSGCDTLSITGPNYGKGALIHFDTEQSQYDRQQLVNTALRRAGLLKPPDWYVSYLLTGKSAEDSRRLVESAMRLAKRKHKTIFAVIIDGVADLVNDVNEGKECFPLVTKLHALAIEYNTAIINVLHLNPGSDVKGRGHLGSQLERKSESNLMMEIDKSGVTTIWGEKQRGKAIRKADAVAFKWSDELRMHVSCSAKKETEAGGEPKRPGPLPKYDFAQFDIIWPRKPDGARKAYTLYKMAREMNSEISERTFRRLIEDSVVDGKLVRLQDKDDFTYHLPMPAPAETLGL